MGDFDRRESAAKKNESKKLVMVGILGALLLGLVVFQFNKKSPEAMAGPVAGSNGGGQPAAIEQTPEQAMALLARDPTSGLLDTKSLTSVAAAPPRNPFVMDATWRETFAKHIDAPNPQKNTNSAPVAAHSQSATPLSLSADNYKLNGIMQRGDTLYAIINNKILTTGNVVGKARVVAIQSDSVSLQHVDSPDGPLLELSSKPVEN